MQLKKELTKIVGSENVSDKPEILTFYSRDMSLSAPGMPNYVAKPENTIEVQQIVKLANEFNVPVVPCSSGIHFNGNTIPNLGGIVIDLRRMNNILNINTDIKMARVEPGVTWRKLQSELAKQNMMALCPLLPHPLQSVVTSHLEREPKLIPKYEYAGSMVTLEVVLPDGEIFRTGSASVPGFPEKSMAEGVNPGGPGDISWHWLLQGAEGTMGVVTWAQVKIAPRPKINKTFIIPFEFAEDAIELVYNVQRRMLGEECFILNSSNMAAIAAQKWPDDSEKLKRTFKPWMVILVLGGGWRLPEGRIEYEEQGLREAAAELHIPELPTSLPGVPGIERELPDMLRTAWPEDKTFWKFASKGASQDLFFLTTLDKTSGFIECINQIAASHGHSQMGFYVQPLEYGRACHFECNFSYDPCKLEEVEMIRNLYAEVSESVLEMGAFFTRPYGAIADMVYERAAGYTATLKKVKKLLDPNNIMSPGRLCF